MRASVKGSALAVTAAQVPLEPSLQWPPLHGGRFYWWLRGALFKTKRFNRRVLRCIRENYDRQHLRLLMHPQYSYDFRVNEWEQSPKRQYAAGIAGRLGPTVFYKVFEPSIIIVILSWLTFILWKQEKHPFQYYLKWKKIRLDRAIRQRNERAAAVGEED